MVTPPEPIAIIGLSCRFPGGADTPSKLWDILKDGRQTWTDVPEDRWNWKSFYHPHPEANGTHNSRGGCFLEGDISKYDAGFFNMPPSEAHAMDPQHRIQLESAYEALENAGISAESVRGTNTGVYMAVASRDYDRMAYKDTNDLPKYHLTGVGDPVLCGRISYIFDLKGPSITLDTGCSGSMVCLHQAAASLRSKESSMALVGGTHCLLGPDLTMTMSLLHMMNDNGRCYSFDSRGSGYGRAEGVATVVLKRLDDAIADGDPIRAVLRNTGCNSDGKTNGILLPNSSSQQILINNLYDSAGIDPSDCDYVEAHGTGTAAGDSAETNTISSIFCKNRTRETPLFIGSVKANIGHTEATSGLAGLIKVVLMLEKGLMPPVPGIETLKDGLNLGSHIEIPRTLQPWPRIGKRIASINSFGFGGTNAHCIVEAAPKKLLTDSIKTGTGIPQLFIISAKTEKSLKANIENLSNWVSNPDQVFDISDLAFTLATRRSMMRWRWSTVASDRQSLIIALMQKGMRFKRAAGQHRIVFLFTGQGAQWAGMAKEIIHTNSIFTQSLIHSDEILKKLGCSWSLLEELLRDKAHSRINESVIAQPASTALQIALVDLMHSLNIKPYAVLGHSSGEIGAAYAAGFLTSKTALCISYQRSFVLSWCKDVVANKGAMMAVGLGEEDVLPYISSIQHGVAVVACQNSPSSVTVSGDEIAIDELKEILDQNSIFVRKLQVDAAYHSHHMKAVASKYLESLSGVVDEDFPPSGPRFFSSVTGKEKMSEFGASYWVENLISKVRYSDALQQLSIHTVLGHPVSFEGLFIEIGPHGALAGPTRQTLSNPDFNNLKYTYLSSLSRNQNAFETILEVSGKFFEQGVLVDLKEANSLADERSHHVLTDLPSYAWDHSIRYWNESRLSRDYRMRNHPPDEILGLRIPATSPLEPTWRNMISSDQVPWAKEHVIDNFALFPGSAYLCMAMQALTQILLDRQISGVVEKFIMRDIIYSKALIVPDTEKIEIQLSLRPTQGQADLKNGSLWQDFRITSCSSDSVWNEHCRGSITVEFETVEDRGGGYYEQSTESQIAKNKLDEMKKYCSETMDAQNFYDGLRRNGIDYGEHFSILKDIRIGDCKTLGTIAIPNIALCMPAGYQRPHIIHPTTMDAVMHIVLPLYSRHCSTGAVMLVSIDQVTVSSKIVNKPSQELTVTCDFRPAGPRSGTVDWSVFQLDEQSKLTPVVTLSHGEFRGIGQASDKTASSYVPICYQKGWEEVSKGLANAECISTHRAPTLIRILSYNSNQFTPSLEGQLYSVLNKRGLDCSFLKATEFDKVNTSNLADANILCIYICSDDQDLRSAIERLRQTLTWSSFIMMIIVSRGQSEESASLTSVLSGFARTARKENDNLKLIMLEVQDTINNDAIQTILNLIINNAGEVDSDYVLRNGQLLVPRLRPVNDLKRWMEPEYAKLEVVNEAFHQLQRPLKLHVEIPGLLNSMVFVDNDFVSRELGDEEVEVQTMAIGVNSNDVAVALGRAKSSSQMLGEFSGIVTAVGSTASQGFHLGQRVCGWSGTTYASYVRVNAAFLQPLPESLSFSQGASIPVVFEVAYQALVETARLQQDHTVLIHSAAGAVGQAAIMIAQHIGAQIFVTVGSSEKRRLLTDHYGISESHIFSSRTRTFKKGLLSLTDNRGVDIILNYLSGDMLTDTWECIAEFGVFVEMGSPGKHRLSMQPFERNVTLASIDLELMRRRRPLELQKILQKIMEMFSAAQIHTIYPLVEIPLSRLETAFRQVQTNKHAGKIILVAEEVEVPVLPANMPVLKLNNAAFYIIVNRSDEGLGRKIAHFMISRGAKSIFFLETASQVKDILEDEEKLLAIKGVIHVSVSNGSIYSKSSGATNEIFDLDKALKKSNIDFFITISAIEDALGTRSNAEQAVNCAWKELFANSSIETSINYLSLVIGPITETKAYELSNPQEPQIHSIQEEQLMRLLNFAMQTPPRPQGSREIWMGIQRPQSQGLREDALLSHVTYNEQFDANIAEGAPSLTIDKAIARASSTAEIQNLIRETIASKIASLVAMDSNDISLDASIASFGLDSLIAIEFKNWIGRILMAPMQTSEILDVPDIIALASLVTERTTFLTKQLANNLSNGLTNGLTTGSTNSRIEAVTEETLMTQIQNSSNKQTLCTKPTLPKLPLNDLNSFLSSYFESVRGFLNKEELNRFVQAMIEFKQPRGIGHQLQARLVARAEDPKIENWNAEQFLRESYLDRRPPLVPYSSFFFTHPLSKHKYTQAEKAALVVTAAFQFKQKIDAGQVEQQFLNERPLCMRLSKWIFNTAREPRLGSDEIFQFPGYNHIVVLRRGYAFKVELRENGLNVSYVRLRNTLQEIIVSVGDETQWAGVLTCDDRDKWAKNREDLKAVCKDNEEYLNAIDHAAFLICLDDSAPENASDRARQFHFGDGSNRWNDKSTQFVVCTNGVSGFIGDHTYLDANTVAPLNREIVKVIAEHTLQDVIERDDSRSLPINLHELKLSIPSLLEKEIRRVREEFRINTTGWKHVFWNYEAFGSDLIRGYKIAAGSAFQVIVQLAGRQFFGRQNYSWETVSVAHFDQGRFEMNPLTWPAIVEFCEAATTKLESSSTKELRRLFLNACKVHSNSVTAASQGKGTERHYRSLQQMLRPDEPIPLLFSDPLHTSRIRSFDFSSNCFPSEMAEKGYLLSSPNLGEKQPDSLWIHIEVYNEYVKFNITAREGRGDEYCGMIEKAAQFVRDLLESA